MFVIYIDDPAKLLEQYGITAKLFADDVKVYIEISGASDVAKLQATLDQIAGWAYKWQLTVSVSKCNVLTVGHNSLNASYKLNGCKLPSYIECRDLGIAVVSSLSIPNVTHYRNCRNSTSAGQCYSSLFHLW